MTALSWKAACWLVWLPAVVAPVAQAAHIDAPVAAAADGRVQVWVTTSDHTKVLTPEPSIGFSPNRRLTIHIDVDSKRRFQRMVGFGAQFTDSSAWLIQNRLDPAQRAALLQELFGRSPGLGLSLTRVTIGASDFSLRHYSLDDVEAGASDPELAHFSIDANRQDVLPATRAALAINPQLKVMASPWSAPAWMKSNGKLIEGSLLEEHYEAYARYLIKYVEAYAAEGVPIYALTVQNEPAFEPETYPGMRLSAHQRAQLIGQHLGPALRSRGLPTQILEWDHNWDKPWEPLRVLADPAAARYISGVAWHCYGGEITAQSRVHKAFPGKDAYLTECSAGDWEPVRSGGLLLLARTVIIQAARHWARGSMFWNLALDENAGPHAGGCANCRGIVTINSLSGEVTRNDEYYVLAHASTFVRPGARRILTSAPSRDVDNVAFRNADDGSLVLIVTNSAHGPRRFSAAHRGKVFEYELPARSLATFVWKPSPVRVPKKSAATAASPSPGEVRK